MSIFSLDNNRTECWWTCSKSDVSSLVEISPIIWENFRYALSRSLCTNDENLFNRFLYPKTLNQSSTKSFNQIVGASDPFFAFHSVLVLLHEFMIEILSLFTTGYSYIFSKSLFNLIIYCIQVYTWSVCEYKGRFADCIEVETTSEVLFIVAIFFEL